MTAAVLLIFLTIFPTASAARSWLYAEIDPPSDLGSIFYVDLFSDTQLSAAMLELGFDSSLAEYRSADAERDTSDIDSKADGDLVKIVFCDSGAASGKLCRLTFKALGEGTFSATLRMTDGVDGDLKRISPPGYFKVEIELKGSSGGSSRTGSGSSGRGSSSGDSYGGSKSSKTGTADDPESTADEDSKNRIDFSSSGGMDHFLLGAGAALLAVLLVVLGVVIGRKLGQKKKPSDQSPTPDEDKEDNQEISDPSE